MRSDHTPTRVDRVKQVSRAGKSKRDCWIFLPRPSCQPLSVEGGKRSREARDSLQSLNQTAETQSGQPGFTRNVSSRVPAQSQRPELSSRIHIQLPEECTSCACSSPEWSQRIERIAAQPCRQYEGHSSRSISSSRSSSSCASPSMCISIQIC